ncbi:DUF1642 domain-containing protein [Streptococcus suis]|nr:DUF1642 domain-containing protein [Streptococcus suis]NQQ71100.1 DUF1642 domain-containing protein [Streptococcus suis]HEM5582637.1 DUF1642 domain-containing protein [Streptococcus suis]
MNKQEAIEQLEYSIGRITEFGRALNVVPLEKAKYIISQINEPQKVVIPRYVSEWIGYCKANGLTLLGAIEPISKFGKELADTFTGDLNMCLSWVEFNQNAFARAWLFGYEIEQEKLYTVEIPDPNGWYKIRCLTRRSNGKLCIDGFDYEDILLEAIARFTESEIKQDFEWAWQFAKEVE